MDAYNVCEEDKRAIRALFNITDEEVKVKVKMLKEWAENSPNLPVESRDEMFLNIMLLRGKFKEDIVKKDIENYFKTMSRYSEIFAKLGKFKPSEEVGVIAVSKRPTSTWERIAVMRLCPKNMTNKSFNINQMVLVIVTTGMIMYNNDYVPSVRFLLDFTGFSMMTLFKANLSVMFKLVRICEDMLRIRIAGIELYNAPRIVNALLSIARILLKPKMFARVSVHPDLDSVYKNIPKECLPSDYGGEVQSSEELVELWDRIIEEHAPFFDRVANLTKHDNNSLNNQDSLRTLVID